MYEKGNCPIYFLTPLMKLITEEFEKGFEKYPPYSQDGSKNPIVQEKLFIGSATWYLLEYDKETKNAFAFVTGL